MSQYILDTDTLTLFDRGQPRVRAAVAAHATDDVGLVSVTVEEQVSGWYRLLRQAKTPADEAAAHRFLTRLLRSWCDFPVFPLTEAAVARAEQLVKARLNVRRNDLRIAAVALEVGATVVTRNRRDFARVTGLQIEDWSA